MSLAAYGDVGGDDGDVGPGTTGNIEWCGKLQKNGSTVWYCGRGHGSFPPEFRIRNPGPGILEQINLALE
jgi:hypothetical protein